MAIINMSLRLMNRAVPIDYVVQTGDFVLSVKNRYIVANDASGNGFIDVDEIEQMRSDTFVEYCYASSHYPIMDANVFTRLGADVLEARAEAGNLTPDDQRARMFSAIIEAPEAQVVDERGTVVPPNGTSNTTRITVRASDFLSGPGRLEISRNNTLVGANAGFVDGDYFDGAEREFAAADLAALGSLEEGQYQVRLLDQAGNDTSVILRLDKTPPALSFSDAVGSALRDENGNLIADGGTINSKTVRVKANDTGGAGVSTITITGPSPFLPTDFDGEPVGTTIFEDLPNGTYVVTALDRALNVSSITFTVLADQVAPTLTVLTPGGVIIGDGGVSSSGTVHISAADNTGDVQSGLEKITIIGLDPHIDFTNEVYFPGSASVSFSTTLPFGDYWILATDRHGNFSEQTFGLISTTGSIASLQSSGVYLYNEFRGTSVSAPALVSQVVAGFDQTTGEPIMEADLQFKARTPLWSNVVGPAVTRVSVVGPYGYNFVSEFSPPVFEVPFSTMPKLTAGAYQAVVADESGGETVMPFKVVDLTAYLCPGTASIAVSSAVFTVANPICLKSSLGLKWIQESDDVGLPVGEQSGIAGTSLRYPLSATVSPSWIRRFTLRDLESNSAGIEASLNLSNFLLHGSTDNESGAPIVTSQPVDMTAEGFLPGAVLAGNGVMAMVHYATRTVVNRTISTATQEIGEYSVNFNGNVIINGAITLSSSGLVELPSSSGPLRPAGLHPVISGSVTERLPATVFPGNCTQVNSADETKCDIAVVTVAENILSITAAVNGVKASVLGGLAGLGSLAAGGPESVLMHSGVTIDLPAHGAGSIGLVMTSRAPPLRFKSVPPNTAYRIISQIQTPNNTSDITLPVSSNVYTDAQLLKFTILAANNLNPQREDFHPIPTRVVGGKIIGTVQSLNSAFGVEYMLGNPIHEDANIVANEDLLFQSNDPNITLTAESGESFLLKKVLAILRAQGLAPVTPIYHLGPDGARFPAAGVIEMNFNDDQLSSLDILKSTLRIIQFNASGSVVAMPSRSIGETRVASKVPYLTSDFAVFGAAAPVYVDLSPPLSSIGFSRGGAADGAGRIVIDTRTEIAISASDPVMPYFLTSGVAQTRVLIDEIFVDTITTPGLIFGSTFTLAAGAHDLVYYSVDNSGNVERPSSVALFVASDNQPPRSSLVAGSPSFLGDLLYGTSTTVFAFTVADDRVLVGDGLGVGATQTLYAEDGGPYVPFTGGFSLVEEGTHTISYFSVDLEGRAEAPKTQVVGVDLTAPVAVLASSGSLYAIEAEDPVVGGAASGATEIRYLIDADPETCAGVEQDTAAAHGTCGNLLYEGPFALSAGTHTVVFTVTDELDNGEDVFHSSFVTVAQPVLPLAVTSMAPAFGGNGGPLTVSVSGTGIVEGAEFSLNRLLAGAGFTTSGALAARLEASAIRLANGKVLIAGGQDYNTSAIFSSAAIFDPNTGIWSATGAMAVPRFRHTMTLLPDGKVLVAGGTSCSNCIALNTAELYDPATGTWSYTGSLAAVRVQHTATSLANGKVLVAGGGSTNNADLIKSSAELYDPATGFWTSAGVMPSGAHFWHAAALLPDGRVVVAGGRNSSMLLTAAVDIYNPATNTWSPAAPMSATRSRFTLNLLPNGKLIATGGDAGVPLASTEIYDPAPGAGTWTGGAPLSSKRSVHASAKLSDGKILVIGGFAGSAGFVSAAEVFDPVASSWTTVGSLPRLGHTETALADGRILVAGGHDPSGPSATSIYSPASVSIAASNLTYSGGNTIGGALDLTGQSLGLWDVVVTNPNHLSTRLPNAFTIHGSAPPSAVTDLALSSIGLSTVTLQWTAPASPSGALASYEIRYASSPLDSGNFAAGTSVTGPAPATAGTGQSVSIGGLDGVTAFYAALKSRDVYGNASALSNVASWVRGTAAVGDQPEFTFSANVAVTAVPVSTFTAPGTVVMATATAQGLTLVSSIYDLGPEGAVFNPYARMTFVYSPDSLASLGLLPEDIKIYQYVSGVGMVAVSSQTIDTAASTITGYVPSLSSIFAVFGVVKDRAAPVTSLTHGPSATFADGSGNLYASPAAGFGFSAYDPVVFGIASGVARTNYRVDGASTAPFFLYTSTFSLIAEGQRTLWFYSEDHAGNVEVVRSSGVLVDAAAPITTLQVVGSSVAGVSGGLTVSSMTTLALSAADPVSNGVASGVGGSFYVLDANPVSAYGGPFTLPPGAHTLAYFSKDNVANAETANVLSVLVDTVAPRSVLLVDGVPAADPGVVIVSTNSLGFSASDAGAGVAQIRYSLDGAAEQVYISTFSPSAGSHSLAYRGVDRLGNAETAHQVALDVLLYDVTPPVASLSIVDQSTITTNVPVIVATYDDGGRGVDVSSVRLTLDGADVTAQAAVTSSSATFSPALSQGSHDLSISFADFAGNQASAAASFFVDSLPPATILQVNGVAASTTALVVVSTDSLGFASLDAGTGVARTEYSLDGGAPIVYGSTFSLAAGAHTLAYHSIDRAGNVEASRDLALTVLLYDTTPPSLTLTPVAGSTVTTATPQIATVFSDAGRGVDASSVRVSLDGLDVTSEAAVSASSAVFTPSAALSQATHAVVVRVSDLAGNQSVAASTFLVDSLPPVTTLLIDGLATSATSLVLISTDSVGFIATDGGAGVLQTRYALDGSPTEAVYMSTFSLTAGEHTLTYRSFDLGGNEEGARTVSLAVFGLDVTSPELSLAPSHGSTVTVATPLISAHYGDLGRGIDVSSVKIFLDGVNATAQAAVTASSAVFTPGAALSQGVHIVTAEVADFAGNRSSVAATFLVDSVAPVSTLLVNGLATSATSLVLISTDSVGFSALDAGVGTAETRYALDGSTSEVVYVSPFNLAAGVHTLTFHSRDFAGNVEAARTVSIGVLADDTVPPSLALVPVNGSTITTTTPEIRASYSDPGRGVDLASVRISLDGQDVTPLVAITASTASFTPAAALSQGTHTVTAAVSDLAGNAAIALATFHVDSLPPMTALLVNGLAAGSVNLVLASTDAVSFAAADSGAGILEIRYSVDGSSETVFTAPFFLSPGSSSLAFHSRDRAGNLETIKTVSVTVTTPSTDTTPPLVRLDLPGVSALGVEQALGGVIDVRGGVSDASALTWTLEAAPGASAAGGFAVIASGAGNLSGLIAAWNTTTLSGYQTVRLRATDAFGNSASATATVFVGGPVFTFAVGRKDSNVIVNTIKGPTGIAVRSDGAIWVASTENDKILLLSPAGVLLGEAGHAPGHGGREKERGKKDKDRDDEDENEDSGGPSFKTPQGLALDAGDNLYVADRDLNRVVKLSPDGRVLLLQLGKTDGRGRPKPGSGSGELRHPFDVAVDGNGDIYIADSGNRRIQVFNSSGGYLRQFGAGVLLSTSEVRGIALTAEGLWVSDKEQKRVFLFNRAGALLKSIGGADSAVGELSRMRGLASDRLGALYVVEPNRDRVQKFDPQGKGLLAFGSKAGLSQADKKAKRYLTQPIDAAMAPDGSIWIADTGRDRILRYALPASSGYGVAAHAAGGGEFSSSSVEPARRVVDHKDGAKVERDDGAGVSVPKGALTADLEITVEKGDENQDKEQKTAKRREMKIAAVSEEVQYGPEGTTFAAPVTLILPYDASLIASRGIKEDDLKVYYWNPTLKDWQAMPSTVDKQNKTVHAQTTHFSAYQVGGLGGIGVAAVDDFGLRDGYAFPNPSRNGSAVTFRMQPGSVDSIEVRVYDLSGRKVHSSSDFRFLGAIDDGNAKGVQNTYDHVWNVSGVGSGVYTYVMTARKAGQPDIRKTGKAGVIK